MPVDTTDAPRLPTPAPEVARFPALPDQQHQPYQPDDKGIMDPGQIFTRHLAMASGSAASLAPNSLGFRARCAIVDNFTNQYVYLADGNTWVPIYTTGYRVLIVPTDISRADTNTTARGTVTQQTPITGETCVITWCEKVILSVPAVLQQASARAATAV